MRRVDAPFAMVCGAAVNEAMTGAWFGEVETTTEPVAEVPAESVTRIVTVPCAPSALGAITVAEAPLFVPRKSHPAGTCHS